MKTTILIVAAAAMSAAALQGEMPRLTADVPFAFYKGDTKMPAGRYEVKPMGSNSVVLGNSKALSRKCLGFLPMLAVSWIRKRGCSGAVSTCKASSGKRICSHNSSVSL